MSSSLKIPLICKITLRKKKSAVSSKLFSDQKKKKKITTVLWLCPDKLKQRCIDFPSVPCPQVLFHKHVCFNLTIFSQEEKQKQYQRSGLSVVFPHNRYDFLIIHPSYEQKYPSPTQKAGKAEGKTRSSLLLTLAVETFCEWF